VSRWRTYDGDSSEDRHPLDRSTRLLRGYINDDTHNPGAAYVEKAHVIGVENTGKT